LFGGEGFAMRWLRTFLLALLFSLLVGFAIGTLLRLRLERPTRYIGVTLPLAALPFDVCDAGAPVLDPRHHEEQIG
jgi:hypothetical protein